MSDLDALVAHLEAGGVERVYKLGAVPQKPTYPYAVVSTAPVPPSVRTVDGSGDQGGRLVVQIFGRTTDSMTPIVGDTFAAVDGRPLPLTDAPVAWQEAASNVYRDPDDYGVLTATHTFRY